MNNRQLDMVLEYLNEGFISNKLKSAANENIKRKLDQFIKEGNYQAAKNYFDSFGNSLNDRDREYYRKKIEAIKPKQKEKETDYLNDIEKKFQNEVYSYIEKIFNKLKNSSKYKKNKLLQEELYIEKDSNTTNSTELYIATVGIDPDIEYDGNEEAFSLLDDLAEEIGKEVNKKYKNIDVTYDYSEGREKGFSIEKSKIPGNK